MPITLDGTNGVTTPAVDTQGNLAYTGTLTGGTGVINIGSGQLYKDASGNVGIGTTSANEKLSVNGSFSAGVSANAQQKIFITNVAPSSFPLQAGMFGQNGDGDFGSLLLKSRTDFGGFYNIKFYTAASNNAPLERMRITSSGNLLVGTTTSPSGSGSVVADNGFFTEFFVGAHRVKMLGNSARFTSTTGSETLDINVGGVGISGSFHVYASNAGDGGNRYIMRAYMVTAVGTTSNFDQVSSTSGLVDSLTPTFTLSVPSSGVLRLTNTRSGRPALDYIIYFNGVSA
jgi:hypothetical protein